MQALGAARLWARTFMQMVLYTVGVPGCEVNFMCGVVLKMPLLCLHRLASLPIKQKYMVQGIQSNFRLMTVMACCLAPHFSPSASLVPLLHQLSLTWLQ